MNYFIIVIICLFIMGCTREEKVNLSDEYIYIQSYGSVHGIAKVNGESLVFGDVREVTEGKRYIIGKRIPADPPIRFPEGFSDQPYGYFIYQKESDNLIMGLSKKEFFGFLEKHPDSQ